jgi:hypothetical protein
MCSLPFTRIQLSVTEWQYSCQESEFYVLEIAKTETLPVSLNGLVRALKVLIFES